MHERRHLRRLDSICVRGPVFLVTACTRGRRPLLTRKTVAADVVACLREARAHHNWMVGGYVLMPDHIHFFCTPLNTDWDLSGFVGRFKSRSTRAGWRQGIDGPVWQDGFHDRLLRTDESYSRKWVYVQENPVRAGLCVKRDEWPWVGEIDEF